ncbi:head completion adaptor [Vibrio phage 1.263.B._10N.286.51.B1]|nr:head completion adaptor [Vibrio phage 1.263.A._10N.286.51.B1]AUR99272.1 head completion adaptor [Vibrio phage 1.263.B._10N.286.51.B1]
MANYTDITAEVITAFRDDMAAFTDDTDWPDDIVEQALCEADAETGGRDWGLFKLECRNFKKRGMFYYAAHWLATTYIDQTAADASNVSPSARLNVASKSVGDESVQYRVGALQDTADDWLSLTNYGVQFYRMRKRAAMGARAL